MFRLKDPRNRVAHPLMATIGVADITQAEEAYREFLGYELLNSNAITKSYAEDVWGNARLDKRPARILAPQSGAPVFIRLIECDQRDLQQGENRQPQQGWFALELCVADSAALYEKLSNGGYFTPFSPPTELPFSDKIFPFQCRGKNGEILYLNETRGNLPDVDLPIAISFVDHIFIIILSASKLADSSKFYCDLLRTEVLETHEIPYKTINRVYDLPLTTTHKLNTLGVERSVFLEVDQSPIAQSPIAQSQLEKSRLVEQGICCVSFHAPHSSNALGIASENLGQPYNDSIVKQIYGPDGERIELLFFDD